MLKRFGNLLVVLAVAATVLGSNRNQRTGPIVAHAPSGAQRSEQPTEITVPVSTPFHFVAYGDIRFTKFPGVSNQEMRDAIVGEIGKEKPAFISIGGDIPFFGARKEDWKVYEAETAQWQKHDRPIPVFPALGNHEFSEKLLYKNEVQGLANYFAHFPLLKESRFYSIHAGNALVLTLDSHNPETGPGPQGAWLAQQLQQIPQSTRFIFVVLHYPPYTRSVENNIKFCSGHHALPQEQALAAFLETQQRKLPAQIIVFASHVHNYEHSVHGGVQYFTTGGGGACPVEIQRRPCKIGQQEQPKIACDLYTTYETNYHYLRVDVDDHNVKITMRRAEEHHDKIKFSAADEVSIPALKAADKMAASN